jgi:hypothetical protein
MRYTLPPSIISIDAKSVLTVANGLPPAPVFGVPGVLVLVGALGAAEEILMIPLVVTPSNKLGLVTFTLPAVDEAITMPTGILTAAALLFGVVDGMSHTSASVVALTASGFVKIALVICEPINEKRFDIWPPEELCSRQLFMLMPVLLNPTESGSCVSVLVLEEALEPVIVIVAMRTALPAVTLLGEETCTDTDGAVCAKAVPTPPKSAATLIANTILVFIYKRR